MASQYKEYAIGLIRNRNMVHSTDALPELVKSAQSKNLELFCSYYNFDEELKSYIDEHGSIAGFSGMVYPDKILFDIDKAGEDDDKVLLRLRAFIERLQGEFKVEERYIRPYFSGTGYHVVIPDLFGFTPSKSVAREIRETLTTHFPEADAIYDTPRLVRVSGTVNRKSGLFKVPLTLEEVRSLSSDQIKEVASGPRNDIDNTAFLEMGTPLKGFIKTPLLSPAPKSEKGVTSNIATCMQTVYDAGESDMASQRHKAIMSMTSAYKRGGLSMEAVIALMRLWASSMDEEEPGEIERKVRDGYEKSYEYSCKAELFAKYCDPKCKYFQRKDFGSEIVSAETMEEAYIKFVATDFSRTSCDLGELYTLHTPYQIYPGELVLIMGDTKIGKTTLVQNWCVGLKRMKILYLSLEISQHLLFRKFVQIAHNLTKSEAFAKFKAAEAGLSDTFSHIAVSTQAPDLDSLRRIIDDVEPQIVVIDTTDCVRIAKAWGLDKEDAQARGVKDVAQQSGVIILGIHHISKPDKMNPNAPLTVHSGKGASTWEQKADKVISIEGNPMFNTRIVKSLAARDEASFRITVGINWETFKIKQV